MKNNVWLKVTAAVKPERWSEIHDGATRYGRATEQDLTINHRDNYYMTVVLNLIQAERDEFYAMEYMDYQETRIDFIPTDETKKWFTMESTLLSQRHVEYLAKYPLVMKRVLAEKPELADDNGRLCRAIAQVNQERCRELLFKILKDKMSHWWD